MSKNEDVRALIAMGQDLKDLRTIIRKNNWQGKSLLIMAHRYSCEEGHIYPVGIYKSVEACVRAMHRIMYGRGGKYGVIVYVSLPHEPTKDDDKRLIEIYRLDSPYKDKLKAFSQT